MASILERRPSLWVEVSPPRGINPDPMITRLAALRGQVDAINLTDNSLGRVKMSALVFGGIVKQRLGIPVVLNVSCRDRNRFALKSDLLGAAALGIDAVVALRGDKVAPDTDGRIIPAHDIDPFALLDMVGALNRGDTGEGRAPLKMPPSLIAGAVANPNRKNFDREIDSLKRKAAAGARFVITQPVFEAGTARNFVREAKNMGIDAMLGIMPIKRAAMARYMKEQVKDLSGAASYLERYVGMDEEAARKFSLSENLLLMTSLANDAGGFNIMSGGGPSLAIELALEFNKWRKENRK
ncbi:MAG TPA: methylenetetrahydrofolate reductase [Candidatus Binataceae bacterium]|nr:methylenetetrahydrofolate reductase [Candidatus Binataceae bacterium]